VRIFSGAYANAGAVHMAQSPQSGLLPAGLEFLDFLVDPAHPRSNDSPSVRACADVTIGLQIETAGGGAIMVVEISTLPFM
jgi:hypothetical protein